MTPTPKTLTVTDLHALLNSLIVQRGSPKQFRRGIRNYTIALLMFEAGLRVGETVQLIVSDLWYNMEPVNSIIIRTEIAKNKTEREIPVSTRLAEAIKEMNRTQWQPFDFLGSCYAFGREHYGIHPTVRQVERIIAAAGQKALGRRVYPHMLRHTFASRLMRKTNARIVQDLLGHKNLTSTQIYTHPNADDKRKAISEIDAV